MTFPGRKMELSEARWEDRECFLLRVETLITLFFVYCLRPLRSHRDRQVLRFLTSCRPKGSSQQYFSPIWLAVRKRPCFCSVCLESESAARVHSNSFVFTDQGDSFKSKLAMFNNKGVKEPPTDPFHTEDPFMSFSGLYWFLYMIVILLMLFCRPSCFFIMPMNLCSF